MSLIYRTPVEMAIEREFGERNIPISRRSYFQNMANGMGINNSKIFLKEEGKNCGVSLVKRIGSYDEETRTYFAWEVTPTDDQYNFMGYLGFTEGKFLDGVRKKINKWLEKGIYERELIGIYKHINDSKGIDTLMDDPRVLIIFDSSGEIEVHDFQNTGIEDLTDSELGNPEIVAKSFAELIKK